MAQIRADEIARVLRDEIENYDKAVSVTETGTVISVGDGIARIHGLELVMAGELIEFPGGVTGIALNLEEDNVGAVLMGAVLGLVPSGAKLAVGGLLIAGLVAGYFGWRYHQRVLGRQEVIAADAKAVGSKAIRRPGGWL